MKNRRWTRMSLVVASMVWCSGQVLAVSPAKDASADTHAAREHIALLLEASPEERIVYLMETPEQGRALIRETVTSFFDRDLDPLGGAEKAALSAAGIISAWENHKTRWEEGATFFSSKAFVVESASEARILGELLYDLASLLQRMSREGARPVSVRETTDMLLRTVLPEADNTPLLLQYYKGVLELKKLSARELERYAVPSRM